MPILFVCSKETDYLQDLTYVGLSELLGKESLVDFPHHWQYCRERRFFWSKKLEYPRNLGFTFSEKCSSKKPTLNELRGMLRKNFFNLVVFASAKPDVLGIFQQLVEYIRVPWVFVDGGDWQDIGGDFKRLGGEECFELFQAICSRNSPAVVFKREIPLGTKKDFLFPLPFSVCVSKVPILAPASQKKTQVVFWAVESSDVRKEVFKLLKGKYDCEKNGSVSGKKFRKYSLKGDSYFKSLNGTEIALSFRGAGFDTLRFWEIPACGTLLLSERPIIEIPNNFSDKTQAVFCKNNLLDLTVLLDYYLAHKNEALEIAAAGQKHLLKFHTHIARTEYLIDVIESRLKIRLR